MIGPELRILFRKEWRQLLRNRTALLTALLLPLLILLIIPGAQMIAFTVGASADIGNELPEGVPLPPGLAEVGDDPRAMLRALLLPLFVLIGGLLVPSLTATYTMIAEREHRTLELLVALPVRVGQILMAKLLVIVTLASAATLSLFAIDAALILALGIGSVGYVLMLLALLLAALAYSTASALLLSLLARDFRTANNLSGALLAPTIFLGMGALLAIPGGLAPLVLAAFFGLAAVVIAQIARRVVTFERLLR